METRHLYWILTGPSFAVYTSSLKGGGAVLEPNKTTTKKRGYPPFMLLPILKTVVYHTALHWIGFAVV
jgi:hypothetical protein